jgi:hypothetical protein
MKKLFLILLISLIFYGCSTSALHTIRKTSGNVYPVTQESISKVNRIAVLSMLGDKIELKHLGTTVFNNKLIYQSVEWKVDHFLKEIIENEIVSQTKYQIVNLIFDKEKLSKKEKENTYDSENGLPYVNFDFKDIEGYLREVSGASHFDTLILVTRGITEIPGTPQYVEGYSYFTRSFLSALQAQPELFVVLNIQLVDMKSIQEIASGGIIAIKKLSEDSVKKDFGELSIQEQNYLEKILKDVLKDKIESALLDLRLTLDYSNGTTKKEALILAIENMPKGLFNCKMDTVADAGDSWNIKILWCSTDPLREEARKEYPTAIINKKTGTITWDYLK